jgi:hypothetical protein
MEKLKRIGVKVTRTLMAFMFFMNGLAAFLNGLAGKTSYEEVWAPLAVAVGGSYVLYASRRVASPPT